MDFIPQNIARYAEAHSAPEPDLLHRLNRETHLKVMQPRMLSGHLQGRILSMLSKLVRPQRILEIGTYTGYSALCLAEGLSDTGVLHTIDNNPERDALVRKYIAEAGFDGRIISHIGHAADVIQRIEGHFDLVFIDADKSNYSLYYDLIIERVRSGGLIITDNVLWSGKVVEPIHPNDTDTIALLEYNRKLQHDSRIEVVLLPIRDGLNLARKK
ncbi:MAG: O-methyltransferase [Bacteroidia bacterium]|jgi:caffeoyl-CoA O-methyltransferase